MTSNTNKTTEKRSYVASTKIVSEMVTEHAKKIGALGPNEKFTVLVTEGDELTTKMKGYISEKDEA